MAVAGQTKKVLATKPRPGSLLDLILAYKTSPEFGQLAPRTKQDYNRVFDWIGKEAAECTAVIEITTPDIMKLRDKCVTERGIRLGNYVVQVLSLLFKWAKPRGWREDNPAAGAPLIRSRPKTMANRAWSWHEVKTVMEAASPPVRLMIALGLFAGMRQGDAVQVRWSAIRGKRLVWTANKNQAEQNIKIIDPLAQELKTAPHTADTIAVTSRGTPWTQNGFRASFFKFIRKLVNAKKINSGLTYHGLRVTAASRIRDMGGSENMVMGILGDKSKSMAQHYSRDADKRTETDKGFALLEAALEQVQNTKRENAPKKRENAHKLKNINTSN